jgi:hypothetical protein
MNISHSLVNILSLTSVFALPFAAWSNEQTVLVQGTYATELRIPADIPTSGDAQIDKFIFSACKEYGIDPRLIHAVAYQESRYNADAENHLGAKGIMVLMPATLKRFSVEGKVGVENDIHAATKLLRQLLMRFDGNVELALAGFNAGEGSVDKYDGIPPYPATENYVRKITANYGKIYHPVLDPAEARNYFRLTEETISKSITIHGERGYGRMSLSKLPSGQTKLTVNESVTYDRPDESVGSGRIEVITVSKVDGREVSNKRVYFAPALNPGKVRKYRQLSARASEMLPVGAEFTFWAGEGDDPTPISDKVTLTVQPKNNIPVTLQLKDLVASAK